VWVTDADLRVIVRLDARGEPLGTITDERLLRPTGIAYSGATGEIFVADSQAHDIKVFGEGGRLQRVLGAHGEGAGQFNGPTHLAIAHDRLFVTDTLNARVQVLTLDGAFVRSIGRRGLYIGDLPRPKGVAVDVAGRIYVVESYYDYLLVYDPEGRLLLPLGGTGNDAGQFYLPAGVWTDSSNRVFVADMFNSRVMAFEYIGDAAANVENIK
jgi:DNA-binding beta-propeller fold protein YncE